jgi:ubiquinone biosynthesis protein
VLPPPWRRNNSLGYGAGDARNPLDPFLAFIRLLRILAVGAWHGAAATPTLLRFRRHPEDTASVEALARRLAALLEALGPTFIKVGQTLGNRSDLAREELLRPLRRLQDQVRPLPRGQADRLWRSTFGPEALRRFESFDPEAVAVGSIAQVHRARLQARGTEVAVKMKRPRVDAIIAADLRLLRLAARVMSLFASFRRVPVLEAVEEIARAIQSQTDFEAELRNGLRFHTDLIDMPGVMVPKPIPQLCNDRALVMAFVPNLLRLDNGEMKQREREEFLESGLACLYQMIFSTGFIHCDLHPGNIMVGPGQEVVLLDHGLVAELDESRKAIFRDFFLGIVFNEGRECAAILEATATSIADNFQRNEFESEIRDLISRTSSRRSDQFQVGSFAVAPALGLSTTGNPVSRGGPDAPRGAATTGHWPPNSDPARRSSRDVIHSGSNLPHRHQGPSSISGPTEELLCAQPQSSGGAGSIWLPR